MTNNESIKKAADELEALAATSPEEEYKQKVDEEDPEELEEARKKLMLIINVKCKGIGTDVIMGKIKPMVNEMNIADCKNMTEMIKKKGMYGLPFVLKQKTKRQ